MSTQRPDHDGTSRDTLKLPHYGKGSVFVCLSLRYLGAVLSHGLPTGF
jgi:hypothetical protein